MAFLCQKVGGVGCDSRPCPSESCACKREDARCAISKTGLRGVQPDGAGVVPTNSAPVVKETPSALPGDAQACCADCACTKTSEEHPSVLKTQSFKQTAIQRTRTPDEALRVLETTGIDPATLLPAGNAAVTLNEATYTAIAEVMLGRLAWDPALRAWRIVAAEPQAVELNPGMAARPAFEEVRAGHLDTMTWLLMGGSYATITTRGR